MGSANVHEPDIRTLALEADPVEKPGPSWRDDDAGSRRSGNRRPNRLSALEFGSGFKSSGLPGKHDLASGFKSALKGTSVLVVPLKKAAVSMLPANAPAMTLSGWGYSV
jgi:hypothetical protein